MGRLIDADLLIERIYEYQSKAIDTEDIVHSIKTLPTAYDVEKVVEILKEERLPYSPKFNEYNQGLECAIEIVRKGDVE